MKRDHTQAIEMYLAGAPIKEIMSQASISKWGLYLWLKEDGVKLRRKKVDKNRVRELRSQGTRLKKIAAEVGCNVAYASIICRGLKINKPAFVCCSDCGESKPFTKEFFRPKKRLRFDLQNQCRDCYNKYMRNFYRNRKQ